MFRVAISIRDRDRVRVRDIYQCVWILSAIAVGGQGYDCGLAVLLVGKFQGSGLVSLGHTDIIE